MSYRKQISYLELKENGQRVKNVGYARLISLEKEYILSIHINGVEDAEGVTVQLYLQKDSGEEIAGEFVVVKGEIVCEKRAERRDDNSLMLGVRLCIDKNREITGSFPINNVSNMSMERQKAKKTEEMLLSTEQSGCKESQSTENSRNTEEEKSRIEATENLEEAANLRRPGDKNIAKSIKNETTMSESAAIKGKNQYKTANRTRYNIAYNTKGNISDNIRDDQDAKDNIQDTKDNTDTAQHMMDTKWEQLSSLYPHVHPFRDAREFLSVGPEDFVILRERCYQMTHNSFLLHGYYNYRHLLLMRQEMPEQVRYYIGVPGNFYEREKQVARMFGFESFEGSREPAWEGDFGYYMISVEL